MFGNASLMILLTQKVMNRIVCLGTGSLPGPVSELHAVKLTNNSVTLEWSAPHDGSEVEDYIVYFQQVTNATMHEISLALEEVRAEIMIRLSIRVRFLLIFCILKGLSPCAVYGVIPGGCTVKKHACNFALHLDLCPASMIIR